jgi:hypothetical protein
MPGCVCGLQACADVFPRNPFLGLSRLSKSAAWDLTTENEEVGMEEVKRGGCTLPPRMLIQNRR